MDASTIRPGHYHQAINSAESAAWRAAISKELNAIEELKVCYVVELTPSIKTVGTTWVFCVKTSPLNGNPELKAWLCAQGFSQSHDVD